MGLVLRGRDRVRARLATALGDAAAGGVRVVVIEGGPGSGKTVLCQETVRRAHEAGFQIMSMAGVEGEADLALAGLSMLLRPLRARLEKLIEGLPDGQRRALRAASGLCEQPTVDRFTLGAAILGLLATAAERQPVLLVIDDAHWLDPSSAEALSFALRRLGADAVLVVVATRPEQSRLTVPAEAQRAELAGLDTADVAALLSDAGLIVTRSAADAIVAATGGIPLAVLETARALTSQQRDGSALMPDPLPIGRRVTSAYEARLDSLPQRTRRAVALVALAGSAPLSIVVGAGAELDLTVEDLRPAEDLGVLRLDVGGVSFTHPLLRAAALHLPTPSQLHVLHQVLADAASADPEQRARHLAATCTGPDERVAAAFDSAAAAVTGRGGLAAAASLLARAAEFTTPGPARYTRLLAAAQAFGLAGHPELARRAAREVVTGDVEPAQYADAVTVLFGLAYLDGSNDEDLLALAHAVIERVATLDRDRVVRAHLQAAFAMLRSGDPVGGSQLSERAVALLPEHSPASTRVPIELVHASSLTLGGRHAEAHRIMADWRPPSPDDLAAVDASFFLSYPGVVHVLLRLDRYADAAAVFQTLLTVCNRDSTPVGKAQILYVGTDLMWWQGRWPRAVAYADQATVLAEQTGQVLMSAMVSGLAARVFASTGDSDRCHASAMAGMSADTTGHHWVRLYAHAALGLLALGRANHESAAELLLTAEEIRRQCGFREQITVPFAADLVEALIATGQLDHAHDVLQEHRELAARSYSSWAKAVMLRCDALLATDPDETDRLFAAAIEMHPSEVPFDLARTHLRWGEHQRRRRAITSSRTHLHQAWRTFEQLGARPWADRAAAELRAAGGTSAPTRSIDLNTLSPQELHCATLVADGMSNRDVAAALFISAKTVEYHLRKVYTKLGITSRAQLSRVLGKVDR